MSIEEPVPQNTATATMSLLMTSLRNVRALDLFVSQKVLPLSSILLTGSGNRLHRLRLRGIKNLN